MTVDRHSRGEAAPRQNLGGTGPSLNNGSIFCGEVELSEAIGTLGDMLASAKVVHREARLLVRFHDVPLGVIATTLDSDATSRVEREVEDRFRTRIEAHRRADRNGPPGVPACEERHSRLRASAPPVTVVVPTLERPETLAVCLDSLLALDYPDFHVLVVDNARNARITRELLHERYGDAERIEYLHEPRPGASRARNRGLGATSTNIVAFVDDDVRVDRAWLLELTAGFSAAEDVACVTGLIRPMELETRAQRWQEQFGGFDKGYDQQIYDMRRPPPTDPLFPFRVGRFGSGANMAFRVAVLRSIGGFSTSLGPATPARGGEDINAFLKVVLSGHQLVYQPTAVVHHRHPRKGDTMRDQVFGYGVALTACLADAIAFRPTVVGRLLARLPKGVAYLLSPTSEKNQARLHDYPRDFLPRELIGAMYGPVAYLQSRWRARHEA